MLIVNIKSIQAHNTNTKNNNNPAQRSSTIRPQIIQMILQGKPDSFKMERDKKTNKQTNKSFIYLSLSFQSTPCFFCDPSMNHASDPGRECGFVPQKRGRTK